MTETELLFPPLPSFDELKTLADNDPEALSDLRRYYCENFISLVASEHQHQLHCIQSRVELEIKRAKTPLCGVIVISGMMHNSVEKLTLGLQGKPISNKQKTTAKIIPFEPKQQTLE